MVAQYGFPIVVSILLLHLLSTKLEKLIDAVARLNHEVTKYMMQLDRTLAENTKVLYMLKAYLEARDRHE